MLLHPETTWGDLQDILEGRTDDTPTMYYGYTPRQIMSFPRDQYVLSFMREDNDEDSS